MSRFIDELKRTHRCGELRASDIGKEVVLFGWVQSRRDHGSLIFIDLRDRDGLTQIVFDPDVANDAHDLAEAMRGEWVIGVRGTVRSRGEQWSKKEGKMVSAANPKLPTGEIEVVVSEATVFNKAEMALNKRMLGAAIAISCSGWPLSPEDVRTRIEAWAADRN